MACLNPIIINNKITNKYSVEKYQYDRLVSSDNPLYSPELYISDEAKAEYYNTDYSVIVCGCGKCVWCRRKRINSWFIRSLCEMECFNKNQFLYFITLTFSDQYLDVDGYNQLQLSHIQKYIKRVRAKFGWKFKYIAVGEYGSKSGRRHYHLLLYGIPFIDKYTKIKLSECWKYGFSYIKLSDPNSVYYVLKYSFKNVMGLDNSYYSQLGFNIPFFTCSKGFGLNYYEKNKFDILKKGYIKYKNRKYCIPRYFRKLMVFKDEIIHNSYFFDNYDIIQSLKDDLYLNYAVLPSADILSILHYPTSSLSNKLRSYICYIEDFVKEKHSLEVERLKLNFNEFA